MSVRYGQFPAQVSLPIYALVGSGRNSGLCPQIIYPMSSVLNILWDQTLCTDVEELRICNAVNRDVYCPAAWSIWAGCRG